MVLDQTLLFNPSLGAASPLLLAQFGVARENIGSRDITGAPCLPYQPVF
jgi:hypothetical protein